MTVTDFIEVTLAAVALLAFIIYPIVALAKVDKKKEDSNNS